MAQKRLRYQSVRVTRFGSGIRVSITYGTFDSLPTSVRTRMLLWPNWFGAGVIVFYTK